MTSTIPSPSHWTPNTRASPADRSAYTAASFAPQVSKAGDENCRHKLHGSSLAHSGMMDYGEAISTNNEEDQGHEYAMKTIERIIPHYMKMAVQMLHNPRSTWSTGTRSFASGRDTLSHQLPPGRRSASPLTPTRECSNTRISPVIAKPSGQRWESAIGFFAT